MRRGKAAGLDGLTAEHLQHCHPIQFMAKLFNLFMEIALVLAKFGLSYTLFPY